MKLASTTKLAEKSANAVHPPESNHCPREGECIPQVGLGS